MTPQEIEDKITALDSAVEEAKDEAARAKRRANRALSLLADALEKIDDKAALAEIASDIRNDGL
jgi:hypothetical protein